MRALVLVRFASEWRVVAEVADADVARYVSSGDALTEALAENVLALPMDEAERVFPAAVAAWISGEDSAYRLDHAAARTLADADRIVV